MTDDDCTTIWLAVVIQAFSDATAPTASSMACAPEYYLHNQSKARDWLTSDSLKFRQACVFAGLEPDDVRRYALQFRDKGWPQFKRYNDWIEGRVYEADHSSYETDRSNSLHAVI